MTLAPQKVVEPRQARAAQSVGEYPGSTWYGASGSNYTAANHPSSNPINKIVIYVMQDSWSSAINWFREPAAGAPAHYSVRSSDGFVGQSVTEKDIGYHAGNWPYNQTSIGIEQEGFVDDPKWFTDTIYRSSARLSAYLAKKYGIPIDRAHIIGHNEVPYPNDYYDPGNYWDWDGYMGYVRQYAGESSSYQHDLLQKDRQPEGEALLRREQLGHERLQLPALQVGLQVRRAGSRVQRRVIQGEDAGGGRLRILRLVAGRPGLQRPEYVLNLHDRRLGRRDRQPEDQRR